MRKAAIRFKPEKAFTAEFAEDAWNLIVVIVVFCFPASSRETYLSLCDLCALCGEQSADSFFAFRGCLLNARPFEAGMKAAISN
jgi:hypothetical protein